MKAQFKTEWVVEVSNKKNGKVVSQYTYDTRSAARQVKNSLNRYSHARIVRNRYALIENSVIR